MKEVITNRQSFEDVETVLSVCAPITESIGRLEQKKSTLADCLIELLRIVYRLERKQKTLDQDLLSHVKKSVNLRYNQYVTGYHVLALYLHPSGKDLFYRSSINDRNGTLSTLIPTMKKWRYTEDRATWVVEQLEQYGKGSSNFSSSAPPDDTYLRWKRMRTLPENELLRSFSLRLLAITPTAVEAERLFSSLNYINTKQRKRMSAVTLKQLGQIKTYLRSGKTDSLSKAKKEFKTEQTDENSTGGYDDGGESDSDDTVAAAFADHDFERMLHEMDPEDFSEWDMGVTLNECLEVLEIMDAEDTDSTEFIPAKHFDLSHPMISGRNRGSGEGAASTPFAQTAHAGSSNHWSAQDFSAN